MYNIDGGAIMEVERQEDKAFLTIPDAAAHWGCTRANIHYHIQKGRLTVYDVGGMDMVSVNEVNMLKEKMVRRRGK